MECLTMKSIRNDIEGVDQGLLRVLYKVVVVYCIKYSLNRIRIILE